MNYSSRYKDLTKKWHQLLDKYYPEAILLRWQLDHRVFKFNEKIIKIQHKTSVNNQNLHSVKNEYDIYKRIEGFSMNIHPQFKQIDSEWEVLEKDYIDGQNLDEMNREGRLHEASIAKIILAVIKLSLKGITFHQLRNRHIYVTTNGNVEFIDFGGSEISGILKSFKNNFSIFKNGKPSQFLFVLKGLASVKIKKLLMMKNSLDTIDRKILAERQFHKNLAHKYEDELGQYTDLINQITSKSPNQIYYNFVFQIPSVDYVYWGLSDWGIIWDSILRRTSFENKKVALVGGSMGLPAIFSILQGASSCLIYEDNDKLREAILILSKLLGTSDKLEFRPYDKLAECQSSEFDILFDLQNKKELYENLRISSNVITKSDARDKSQKQNISECHCVTDQGQSISLFKLQI